MNTYGFVVDVRQNVLIVGQEKIQLSMTEMMGSTNHSVKQVTVVEKGVHSCGEEEFLVLHAGMEELVDEVPFCMRTEEVMGKPTMFIRKAFACS